MEERTIQCPICKSPYVIYAHYAGDQSACPDCCAKAREGMKYPKQKGKFRTYIKK